MNRVVTLVVVAAGCGGQPATTTVTNAHADEPVVSVRTYSPHAMSAPRPELAIGALVPDPTEEARWPLAMAAHPVLEPHFDIAGALAEPGVSWLDLCGRGIQNRRLPGNADLGDYLRAWCAIANHDTKGALYRLSQLHTSVVTGLAIAVKHDCANILADHGPADDLQSLLTPGQLHDVEILDLTAASYFEVNRNEDAFAVNKIAIDVDHTPSQEVMCRRLVRGIVVGQDFQRDQLFTTLQGLFAPKDPKLKSFTDPVCATLEHEVQCWLDPHNACYEYLRDQHKSFREIYLFNAFEMWPKHEADAQTWSRIASNAEKAAPEAEAYRLVIPSLELAVRTSECETTFLNKLDEIVLRLSKLPDGDPAFEPALTALHAEHDRLVKLEIPKCQQALNALPPVAP